jgi:hypothetical protein
LGFEHERVAIEIWSSGSEKFGPDCTQTCLTKELPAKIFECCMCPERKKKNNHQSINKPETKILSSNQFVESRKSIMKFSDVSHVQKAHTQT